MIILYILLGIIVLVGILLLCNITVCLSYSDEFLLKVKFLNFTLFSSDKPKVKEKNKNEKKPTTQTKAKKSLFKKLKEKYGFSGAVREIFSLLNDSFVHIKKFLRHIFIKKVNLNINVVGQDAAQTAIEYGAVCSAVYPVLSFVQGLGNVGYEKIDVKADFEGKESFITFSAKIKAKIIFILIVAFGIFSEYKKFNARMVQDERE